MKSGSLIEQYRVANADDPWYTEPGPDLDLVFNAELVLGGSTIHFRLIVKNGKVKFAGAL
jgi:hypothetical protein